LYPYGFTLDHVSRRQRLGSYHPVAHGRRGHLLTLYQFLAIAVTLWIVKKSIVDDGRLTIDEGLSIVVIHVLGILLFDELSLII